MVEILDPREKAAIQDAAKRYFVAFNDVDALRDATVQKMRDIMADATNTEEKNREAAALYKQEAQKRAADIRSDEVKIVDQEHQSLGAIYDTFEAWRRAQPDDVTIDQIRDFFAAAGIIHRLRTEAHWSQPDDVEPFFEALYQAEKKADELGAPGGGVTYDQVRELEALVDAAERAEQQAGTTVVTTSRRLLVPVEQQLRQLKEDLAADVSDTYLDSFATATGMTPERLADLKRGIGHMRNLNEDVDAALELDEASRRTQISYLRDNKDLDLQARDEILRIMKEVKLGPGNEARIQQFANDAYARLEVLIGEGTELDDHTQRLVYDWASTTLTPDRHRTIFEVWNEVEALMVGQRQLTPADRRVLEQSKQRAAEALRDLIAENQVNQVDNFQEKQWYLQVIINRTDEALNNIAIDLANDDELIVGNGFQKSFRTFIDFAMGSSGEPPRIVTVGSNRSDWSDDMKKANDAYRKSRELAPEMEQKLASNMLGIWDFMFKTMDGPTMGVQSVNLGEVAANYVKPVDIKEIRNHYGITKMMWAMRNAAMLLLLGRDVVHGKTYSYPDGYVNNSDTFVDAIYDRTFAELGVSKADFLQQSQQIGSEELLDNLLLFSWQVNVGPGRLMDEVYSILCQKGSSMAHNSDNLKDDVAGKESMPLATNMLSQALYNIMNTPNTPKHGVMNVLLFSDDVIKQTFDQMNMDVPHEVVEFRRLGKLYLAGQIGKKNVDKLFGIIEPKQHVALQRHGIDYVGKASFFPSPFESMMERDLTDYWRYYNVDAKGFAWIEQALFEPLESLSVEEAKKKIIDFIKKGYGMAKLAKEGFPAEVSDKMFRLYISRVFRALDYGKQGSFRPRTFRATERRTHAIPIAPDHRVEHIDELRVSLVRDIERAATTLRFYTDESSGYSSAQRQQLLVNFRKGVLSLLGADDIRVIDPGTGEMEVESWHHIPEILANVWYLDEIEKYVVEVLKEETMPSRVNTIRIARMVFGSKFSQYGLIRLFKPPYLAHEVKKESKESH